MKTRITVSLLCLIPLAGTLVHSVPTARTKPLAPAVWQRTRGALLARLNRAPAEFATGNFRESAAIFQRGYEDAMRAHEPRIAARFLNDVGGCRYALHQNQEALETFLEARKLAESCGDEASAGAMDFNISNLYYQLNEMDAAIAAAGRAAARLSGAARTRQLPQMLIHMAALEAEQGRLAKAAALYRQGIAAADRAGDLETYAAGWNDAGYKYLQRKQLPQAERALLEAYRVRKLNRLRSIESSYRNLGMLRLEQGDTRAAGVLLDLAVARSREPGGARPTWEVYYARGCVRLRQKRLEDALEDLRIAARLARGWRRRAPAGDATRVSTENYIQKVHAALVDAGNRLYFTTKNPALARETFESGEANRAASLRALLAEPRAWRRNLPAEYWETLGKLETAEAGLLRAPAGVAAGQDGRIRELQSALAQWEARAGSNSDAEMPGLLARTQRTLGPDAALFAFHLASPDSYVWAVTRDRFALYRLPPGPRIGAMVAGFVKAVRQRDAGAPAAGRLLFGTLFGQSDADFGKKTHWLLALDAQLFELPFAALTVAERAGAPVYLAERHSLQMISGCGMLAPAARTGTGADAGPFVAVADPVYNEADPRWTGARPAAFLGFLARAADPAEPEPRLARLAGSAREAARCAAAWGGTHRPVLLEGAAASRQGLRAALREHPAVLHFATHVVHSSRQGGSGIIVLSLGREAQPEALSPAEIATWNLDGTLVALSGCGSGSADVLPATGLMGLTRACQAAGARAVIASRWPAEDGTGSIFLSFYRHLRATPEAGPAAALQLAQIDMLRSNSWRANPLYWSAYFVTGNQQ